MAIQSVGSNLQTPESSVAPRNEFQDLLANRIEILALSMLIAGLSLMTGLIGVAFAVCIMQAGAFPCLYTVFAENVPTAEAPAID